MKVKLYRFTVKHTEHLPSEYKMETITSYRQTSWGDCPSYIPGKNCELVKIEEKEIEVSEKCLRRRDD